MKITKTTFDMKIGCPNCNNPDKVITKIEIEDKGTLFLCSNCVRELTKELTSNSYLNNDSYESEIK